MIYELVKHDNYRGFTYIVKLTEPWVFINGKYQPGGQRAWLSGFVEIPKKYRRHRRNIYHPDFWRADVTVGLNWSGMLNEHFDELPAVWAVGFDCQVKHLDHYKQVPEVEEHCKRLLDQLLDE